MILVANDSAGKSRRMNAFFADLGRKVRDRWQAHNFSLATFPQIAQSLLDACPPAEHVDVAALIHEFLLDDDQPLQSQSGFGQPELVVYDDPRFYIQILFWLDGTTDIHQHQFSGAFHVLAGSSIHSRFVFEDAESVSAHVRIGKLRVTETQLLETGSTVQIVSGESHIHSLFHLETPSLTVVIRTHNDPGTDPQFTYLPPGLAVDPVHHDGLTTRRKQLLDVLEQTEDPAYADTVLEMIGRLDFERGFFILQNGLGHLRNLGRWEEALSAFSQKHGRLAELVPATLEEIVRRDALAELRSSVGEVEHRFFLALLLNVGTREEILSMVAQRFDGDPLETILRWADELTTTSEVGTWIVDAEFPATLGVSAEAQPERFLAALERLMKGDEQASSADHDPFRAAVQRSSLRPLVA